MKKNMPTVLVLGATGMLGRIAYSHLLHINPVHTFGTTRKKSDTLDLLKAGDTKKLEKILHKYNPDYVVNCIGVLSNSSNIQQKKVNTIFPKTLEKLSNIYKYKLIHISTDAVYAPTEKFAYEDSPTNPLNSYAVSKLNGEVKTNSISIRTSILGLDPNEHKGLLEYALSNDKNKTGYINQIWSGGTTIQIARFIEDIIYNDLNMLFKKTHIVNFAPLGPVSKHKILMVFLNTINNHKIKLNKEKSTEHTTVLKSLYLNNTTLKRYNQVLADGLLELVDYDTTYSKKFKK